MKKIEGLEWYKTVLEENSPYLLEKLSLNTLFLASLMAKHVLTSLELEDIEDEAIQSRRCWKLVKLIQKKSTRNFTDFVEVLRDRGQKYIAAKLIGDCKHKARYNESERSAQENINSYVHRELGQSTKISITEQTKLKSELVLQKDYQYVTSVNRGLLTEIEELEDDLKEERKAHAMTRDQLNDMIKQFKFQLNEAERAKDRADNLETEFKKSLQKIKELQNERTQLREEIDRTQQMSSEETCVKEVSDDYGGEMKADYEEKLTGLSAELQKLQNVIKDQEQHLQTMNSKVHAIVDDLPAPQSDGDNADTLSSLECLERIIAHLNASPGGQPQKQAKNKQSSKEKRQELLKQIEEMNTVMQGRQEEWERERQEILKREQAMQRNINNYRQDIRSLKKKVEELNTPTPERRGRSDSLEMTTAPLQMLPKVDIFQHSFMVTSKPHLKPQIKRTQSKETMTSLPTLTRPTGLIGSASSPSGMKTSVSYNSSIKSLHCVQCANKINQTQLMTTICQYHNGCFNKLQQTWSCCHNPLTHKGCTAGSHHICK